MTLGAASSILTTTLRGLSRWYAGVQDANNFTDAQIDGLLNRWLHTFQIWILEVYGGWKFSGASADTNLAVGTNNYAFPTDYLEVNKIEVNYSGNSNDYHNARVVDLRGIADAISNLEATEDRISSGIATVYILNNRLYLKNPPGTAVTNGLRVYYSSIQTELSATTDEPIIPEHFHKGLSIGTAMDFSIANLLVDRSKMLETELLKVKLDMQSFFVDRMNTGQPRFKIKYPRVI